MEEIIQNDKIDWNSFPFTGSKIFKNNEIEKVWNDYYKKERLSSSDTINYNVVKSYDNSFFALIKGNDKNRTEELNILKYPKTFNISNDKKEINNLIIYSEKQFRYIFNILKCNNYLLIIKQNNNILNYDKTIINEKNIIIEAKYIDDNIENYENFKDFVLREKIDISSNKIITIEKNKLSLYFNEFSLANDSENDFRLLIDENRLNFIENIDKFLESKNLFYFIMGTDGIGKTTTLLYYTSSIINNNYIFLYLNLKLFLKSPLQKIDEIFFNELKRLFILEKELELLLQSRFSLYKDLIKKIKNKVKEKENISNMEYFWSLLFAFIEIYTTIGLHKQNLLIILDQYKNESIDSIFYNLNTLEYNIINNYEQIFFKVKLLVVISINNYDTKKIFLDNFETLCFYQHLNGKFLLQKYNNINKDLDNENKILIKEEKILDDFKNIENYLNDSINRINKKYKNNIIDIIFKLNPNSQIINSCYSEVTQKEYLNIFTNCSELFDKDLPQIYKNCIIKVFKGSLKYYQLLLNIKNKNKQNKNEKEEDYQKRIIKNFYKEMYNKFRNNILKSYKRFYYTYENVVLNQKIILKSLINLRKDIYEEKRYTMFEITKKLEEIPIKYLDITLDYYEYYRNANPFSVYYFKIQYSNNFVKQAINKLIKELSNKHNYYGELGFGEEFERKVNKKLSNFIINNKNIVKRNIFALVGLSKSSKKYIEKLKEKEKTEYYDFFGLKRLEKITIDGINEEKIKSSVFNIKLHDVFLNQISKTGRSFDSGLLIKKDNMTDSKTHDLVLFQVTTSKVLNKEKKNKYIQDSYLSKTYLEKLYEGLKIDQIYFIFIIPINYPNVDDTKKKLEELQIYYLYFYEDQNIFLNKDYENIKDFRINSANITFPNIKDYNFMKSLSDIQTCKKVYELSKMRYLNKVGTLNFIDIYNKVSEENFFDCVTFLIPKELKDKILDCFYSEAFFNKEDKIIFLPSTNYNGNKILDLFRETKNMIIFSINNDIYLYYYYYYKIEKKKRDFNVKKNDNFTINNHSNSDIDIFIPTKNIEDFNEIKKYPLYLFCYQIIKNYIIDY